MSFCLFFIKKKLLFEGPISEGDKIKAIKWDKTLLFLMEAFESPGGKNYKK